MQPFDQHRNDRRPSDTTTVKDSEPQYLSLTGIPQMSQVLGEIGLIIAICLGIALIAEVVTRFAGLH
jgi:hypothetical protein